MKLCIVDFIANCCTGNVFCDITVLISVTWQKYRIPCKIYLNHFTTAQKNYTDFVINCQNEKMILDPLALKYHILGQKRQMFCLVTNILTDEYRGPTWVNFDKKFPFLQKCDLFKITFCDITWATKVLKFGKCMQKKSTKNSQEAEFWICDFFSILTRFLHVFL